MPLHVALTHRTSYRYAHPIALGPQTIRLRPAPHTRTPILSYALRISPQPHFLNWQQDPQGNFLARVVFPERVGSFEVTVDLTADMATINPFDFFLEPEAETFPFSYDPVLSEELAPFRKVEAPGPRLAALIEEARALVASRTASEANAEGGARTVPLLVAFNQILAQRISYVVRMEPGVWTPEQTLGEMRGSCRDSGWLLVQLLRHLGFAARFVSGYLIQLKADQPSLDGPSGPSEDFTDLHAWAEVYLPGAGWVGLDATSGLMTGEGHIPLAASPEPASAAAISGLLEPVETEFGFHMGVTRVHETPRTTKPIDDAQWDRLLAAGDAVEGLLTGGDVRLTMGGEPTFIAMAEMDAPIWNSEALGGAKRHYAGRLIRALLPDWAKGAALQYATGKHYPGEQLPRWAIHAHFRPDGEPVWKDTSLLASDDDTPGATYEDAHRFARLLAERLGVDPDRVLPAYEDTHYQLWREYKLPANVLVEDAKLADPAERARLARVFGRGLSAPVGDVLPLRRAVVDGARVWETGRWQLRSDVLLLVQGDSPIGVRLPLQSLPWAPPEEIEALFETDPLSPRAKLPEREALGLPTPAGDDDGEDPATMVRTALTVESRLGFVHVFLPPLYEIEDWLDLIARVESVAAETGQKVFLEGYTPPRDPRVTSFSITPDPGVVEINIHPATSWREWVDRSAQLYDAAHRLGLGAEKFMLDGRHVGSGGGNHMVMGATTPADSPFLRRPDLLKSLLGFWHNHPSLSYLFSGLFIGPMSQHPRIDEARMDAISELEIAFAQIGPKRDTPPWAVDRLLRNILVDMTGNTHRTEFCIDKLYSPDSSSGRLGLVEYRAMEMPPDPRMAAAQALLLRAAVAAFWTTPYERRLIRWGTRLHDRFMLPHYVAEDFRDVIEELNALLPAEAHLDAAWFDAQVAFRFPHLGAVRVHGIGVSVEQALEPWHVLGETAGLAGMIRAVDNSVERLQVSVENWEDSRYILACNGYAVPLVRTDDEGRFVGGVRFKAWRPAQGLHPLLPAQTPLVFDIYDRWTGRSLGGLTHHAAHPGGRNYETFPVNANEAEARRRIRFQPFGHTPGPMEEPKVVTSPEHPLTLDLRRTGWPNAMC